MIKMKLESSLPGNSLWVVSSPDKSARPAFNLPQLQSDSPVVGVHRQDVVAPAGVAEDRVVMQRVRAGHDRQPHARMHLNGGVVVELVEPRHDLLVLLLPDVPG